MAKLTLADVGNMLDGPTAQGLINDNSALIETALENTLSRDGTAPNTMGAALDMNSNQIYNLPEPSTVNSPARLIDVVSNPTISIPGQGTSGHVVGFLDTNNTHSGNNTFSGSNAFQAVTATTIAGSGNATIGGTLGVTGVATFSAVPVVPNSSFANAKLANMANSTVKGNVSGGAAAPSDLTATQLTTLVNPVTSALSGAAPASGGGTANFLRADATWTDPNNRVLISTLTASASASLATTNAFTSTYSSYEIVFQNIIPATDGASPVFQIYSGSLRTSGYVNSANVLLSTAAYQSTVANTASITMAYNTATDTANNPNNTTPGINGILRIFKPSDAAEIHPVMGDVFFLRGDGTTTAQTKVGGIWNTAGAITGFTFAFGAGNITSGTIKIYGII